MSKIYLAHPITGLSADEVFEYYDTVSEELEFYHTVFSPMSGKDELRTESVMKKSYDSPVTGDHAIFERDMWMVEMSDMLLCDFTGAGSVSIGCCMEIAWASKLNHHTIIVMEDGNIHDRPFMREAADVIFPTLKEAIKYINQLP